MVDYRKSIRPSTLPGLAARVVHSTRELVSRDQTNERQDYVIVVDREIKKSPHYNSVLKFINYLQGRGIKVEAHKGIHSENLFVLLHITQASIETFAIKYDIEIEDTGRHYMPIFSLKSRVAETPLTEDHDLFYRQEGEAINTERIMIIYEMLCEARWGDHDHDYKYGIWKLENIGAVKDYFPLHDGPYEFDKETPDDELNERQLLLKYWANFSHWYKKQPLNLIEKYFGTEVAFYFAWLGFYNMMLIPASIVGLICFIISILLSFFREQPIRENICASDLHICPRCSLGQSCVAKPLKNSCGVARLFEIFDSWPSHVFAIFMAVWATLFINLWVRVENILKIRWNVTDYSVSVKTSARLAYKEKSTHSRISQITGRIEYYTPCPLKSFHYFLSFGGCFVLVAVVLLAVFCVILYRIVIAALITMSDSPAMKNNTIIIEACTSSLLQVIFIQIFAKFYAPLSEWLTILENPRTQMEFDNSILHKRYILGFANNYSALFYMAFVKGRLYYPANTAVIGIQADLCSIRGCIVPLCVQLFVIMLLKSMAGNILTLMVPKITTKVVQSSVEPESSQWEKEYELKPAGRYLLTTEFMEMVVQYGFVTFFVAAFPLAPLCALINNCMELRLDAYKLVTRFRRPQPKRQAGIGPWRDILQVITHLSTATNAFVLAFTSDFVSREIYRHQHGTLDGYIKSVLSIYDMRDNEHIDKKDLMEMMAGNNTLCYYRAKRYPPDHPRKYQLTNRYWFELGMRFLCVIIFEHFVSLCHAVLSYLIPEVPEKIARALCHERERPQNILIKEMHDAARKRREMGEKPKVKIVRKMK